MAITFYATVDSDSIRSYMPDVPVLLPASSWARKGMKAPKLPPHMTHSAADSGGFVATFRYGGYTYTLAQYVSWLHTFHPRWAATMDLCCENEITSGKPGVVRERQAQTTANAWQAWREYKHVPWAWVPTVQGWHPSDYRRHARELKPLIDEMADYYGAGSDAWRVGIGTLCRRASVPTIRQVAAIVAEELPGVPLHLWGIKLGALKSRIALPEAVVSVDSAAWSALLYKGRETYHESGLTQRQYIYRVALPRYIAQVEAALDEPKQLTMLEASA